MPTSIENTSVTGSRHSHESPGQAAPRNSVTNTFRDILGDSEVKAPIGTWYLWVVALMQGNAYLLPNRDSGAGPSWGEVPREPFLLVLLHRSDLAAQWRSAKLSFKLLRAIDGFPLRTLGSRVVCRFPAPSIRTHHRKQKRTEHNSPILCATRREEHKVRDFIAQWDIVGAAILRLCYCLGSSYS